MTGRPELTTSISAEDFCDYYCLKEELLDFCRKQGMSSSGSKQEVNERIEHFLRTGEKLAVRSRTSNKGRSSMPEKFTRETVIGSGYA